MINDAWEIQTGNEHETDVRGKESETNKKNFMCCFPVKLKSLLTTSSCLMSASLHISLSLFQDYRLKHLSHTCVNPKEQTPASRNYLSNKSITLCCWSNLPKLCGSMRFGGKTNTNVLTLTDWLGSVHFLGTVWLIRPSDARLNPTEESCGVHPPLPPSSPSLLSPHCVPVNHF